MNYAGPIFIGLVLLALLDWFTTGRKRFVVPTGPIVIPEDDQEMESKGHANE
jgi:hypothetical protein